VAKCRTPVERKHGRRERATKRISEPTQATSSRTGLRITRNQEKPTRPKLARAMQIDALARCESLPFFVPNA